MHRRATTLSPEERPRYIERVEPIVFPEEAEVPETQLHLEIRTLLYQLLSDHLGLDVTVGSDQFVYFDAANPKQCVAPDVYVRLAPRAEPIRSWKIWERGSPEVAVEVISDDDASPEVWADKLRRYAQVGVSELVRFDPESSAGPKLRIWDRVQGALVERAIDSDRAPSLVLDLHWCVAPADSLPLALRVATGNSGETLVLTRAEARKAEAEARKAEAEARKAEAEARKAEAEARKAAEARIRELEAELRRRST
jgi:Uma2 family endonuclease